MSIAFSTWLLELWDCRGTSLVFVASPSLARHASKELTTCLIDASGSP